MTAPDPTRTLWRKSSRSSEQGGQCVEVAQLRPPARSVGLRDSTDPSGPVLAFTPSEWSAFLARVKAGAVDG